MLRTKVEVENVYLLVKQGVKQAVDELDYCIDDSLHRFRSVNERRYTINAVLSGYYHDIADSIDWEQVERYDTAFDKEQIIIDQAEETTKKMIREDQIEEEIPF